MFMTLKSLHISLLILMLLVRQIDGDVYDVSKGKAYQLGGSYHHLCVPYYSSFHLG
jgi:hypothetical protein